MGIRPGRAIRATNEKGRIKKRAWTRYSKRRPRQSFIKSMPHADLHQFRMGAKKDDYDTKISLISQEGVILRDNAIESARQSTNKHLEEAFPGNYYFVVRVYPHHVIRENKMIAGAGADRLQKGMRAAFGRPTDRAARLHQGTALFTVYTYKANAALVKSELKRATRKISGTYRVVDESESPA